MKYQQSRKPTLFLYVVHCVGIFKTVQAYYRGAEGEESQAIRRAQGQYPGRHSYTVASARPCK